MLFGLLGVELHYIVIIITTTFVSIFLVSVQSISFKYHTLGSTGMRLCLLAFFHVFYLSLFLRLTTSNY